MPLEQAQKSALREKVSTANKSNVNAITEEVTAALGTLDADDKDYARVQGWLEDLATVKGGGVPGEFDLSAARAVRSLGAGRLSSFRGLFGVVSAPLRRTIVEDVSLASPRCGWRHVIVCAVGRFRARDVRRRTDLPLMALDRPDRRG